MLHFLLKHRRWVSLQVMEFTIILIYRLKKQKTKTLRLREVELLHRIELMKNRMRI